MMIYSNNNMNTKNVIIVTDCTDIAIQQVKARFIKMLSKDMNINFFDVFVSPFAIKNGAFLSKLLSDELPHGKNTTLFVCANTGIFSLLFEDFGIKEVWQVKEQGHYPFGGLHIHTFIAGSLLCGLNEEKIGVKMSSKKVKKIEFKKGEVVHIDNFGLIKIWSRINEYDFKEGDLVRIKILNKEGILIKEIIGVYGNRMMNYPDNTLVVYPGSSLLNKSIKESKENRDPTSGLIEIGIVRETNSAEKLGVKLGSIVILERAH